MVFHRDIIPVAFPVRFKVLPDGAFIFAMRGNNHLRAPEDPFQDGFVIHEHVPGGGPQKQFYAGTGVFVEPFDFFEVVIGTPQQKGVVGVGRLGSHPVFLFQFFKGGRLWDGIGLLHKTGDTPSYGSPAFGCDIPLVGKSRLSEMYLVVNQTGKEVIPPEVYHPGIGVRQVRPDPSNPVPFNQQITFCDPAFVDKAGIF